MNFGPRNMQSSSEAMPAMRISPSISAPARDVAPARPLVRQHPLESGRARPLHEHAVARLGELLEHRAGLLRAGDGVLLALEPGRYRQRRLADGDQHVDPELVRQRADLAVVALA